MTSRLLSTLLASSVVLGLVLVPTIAARADDGDANWTVRTASNSLGSERTGYTYTLNPGAKIDDGLVVTNRGTEPLDLGVYAADGYTTESGQFDLVVGGVKSVNVGAWIRTDAGTISLQPGQTIEVPFTLTVPANATPGDYAGGVVTSLAEPNAGQGINVDRRLGIRITLRVGGELAPGLQVEQPHISWSGSVNPLGAGQATLTYTLHNTGNTLVSAQQLSSLSGPFGWFAVKAGKTAAIPQLLPGEKWKVTVPFHGVVPAFMLIGTAAVTPVVTDASGSTTTITPVVATANGWAIPWALLATVVLALGLAVGAVRWVDWRSRRRRSLEAARVEEAVSRALEEVKNSEAGKVPATR